MANFDKKIAAFKLRNASWGIWDIAKTLNIPTSLVSIWCRDIILSPDQIKKIAKRRGKKADIGRLVAGEKIRQKRIDEVKRLKTEGIKEIGRLNKRELFLTGLGLYWGEGYKGHGTRIGFTNSDPKTITFMLQWFRKCCGISNKDFILRISINEVHRNRKEKIENYWSQLASIPLNQFTKTTFIQVKNKKIFANDKDYYGTLRVNVRRSTKLQRKTMGWLEGLTLGGNQTGV